MPARGMGVATALIQELVNMKDECGVHRLYWFTKHDNLRARSVYDKLAKVSDFVRYDIN